MFDALDIMAFAVFAVIITAMVIVLVTLGQLPGKIAERRGHPQAAAINAAGWLALVLPVLWPIALIWAFLRPIAPLSPSSNAHEGTGV
jgi:hypothetical protein